MALDRGETFVGARRLLHVVALPLELDPDELAHPLVVVDEQDGRARLLAARARAGEERLEIAAPEAPVAAGRVEGRDAALIRPLADRALGDAEEARGLAEGQPLGLAAHDVLPVGHEWNLTKTHAYYTWDVRLGAHPHGS